MRQAIDPITARPVVQQACNSCRTKKLRCSGEKTGCGRCKAVSRPCVYAEPVSKGAARYKKKRKSLGGNEAKGTMELPPESRKQTLPSPPATTPEKLNPSRPNSTEGVTDGYGDVDPMLYNPLEDFSTESAGHDGGIAPSLLHFDMLVSDGGMGRYAETGLGSNPNEIEQWLSCSPREMDLCLWTTDGINNVAFDTDAPLSNPVLPLLPIGAGHQGYWLDNGMLPTPKDNDGSRSDQRGHNPVDFNKAGTDFHMTSGGSGNTPNPMCSEEGCHCLQQVMLLIDELESAECTQLDTGLVSHKRAIRHGEAMLMCGHCTTRTENVNALAFLTDLLATLCSNMVVSYRELLVPDANMMGSGGQWTAPSPIASSAGHSRRSSSLTAASDGSPTVPLGMYFGDYEVDCPGEWQLLAGNLISVQAKALRALLGRVRDASQALRCHVAWKQVVGAERRLEGLLEQLTAARECS
ncbi:hypothetical protein B0H63DRAFT_558370 [Podospora didyma]|uniref:Zn(2)-C6 fungal-type domain-containing protein n=1 Tax=Podospora didyma TaxID=330526 RepID=A0AAE0U0S0_9PEZI|nr:hypothetical protein B0H63DRAFT_558370 [Podospora didyma]